MKRIDIKILGLYLITFFYTISVSVLFIDKFISNYSLLINPIMWLLLFLLGLLIAKDFSFRFKSAKEKAQTVLIVVLSYLIIYFLSGIFLGYATSPFSHELVSIFKNIWSFLIIIIFQEYIRYVLLNNCSKNKVFYILVTVLFILIDLNFYKFNTNFSSGETAFKYISSVVIPSISKNMLLSYLAIVGGLYPVLAYELPIMFANIMLPIFPNHSWFVTALFELVLCLLTFLYVNFLHVKKTDRSSRREIKKSSPVISIPFLLFLFVFVGFVAGFFKYMPIAVMSNSMKPIINRGDIVVVDKINESDKTKLKVDDVIEYELDGSIIIHRIGQIIKSDNGEIKFITKGDNNNAPDFRPVTLKQVRGKVLFKIPYIGYPVVYLNEFFNNTKPNVET